MIRYFFHIAYKGTAYRGWQRQKNTSNTIQEIIESRLENILKYRTPILGCGRTDSGVHASQYFFHVDIKAELSDDFISIINKILPADIVVFDIFQVEQNLHAQFNAIERTYDYFIHTYKDPYLSQFSSYYDIQNLNFAKMKEAANRLLLYNDFRAFCKTPDRHTSTICIIKSVDLIINETKNKIRFTITANRFLKSMIRIIVYNLIQVAKENITLDEFELYLKNKQAPEYFNQAYPQGLYLSRVKYPSFNISPQSNILPLF
ncbi:MAG: tRNA pseudouridine(38-40) synthase TruA [Bacteroidales bacterium]|nr:tRNA pseudouridine(38-40) synthase TruA [Bacteroidales bacterium]